MTPEQERCVLEWKIKLADAILQETPIEIEDIIEPNCGTVWITHKEKIYALNVIESE